MKSGIIENYNPQRGFGFIAGVEGESNIFVHYSGLIDKGANPPKAGDEVTYDVAATSRGPKAVNVRIVSRPDLDASAPSAG